jgi:tetratricopeptide (TPR) repeat protein
LELGHESIDVASDLCDLASVVCALERYAEGEALHREAMRIRQLKRGHDSLEVAASLAHLAAVCAEQNRVEEAEAMYKKALRIREEKLGYADAAAAELRVRLVELQPPPLSDI